MADETTMIPASTILQQPADSSSPAAPAPSMQPSIQAPAVPADRPATMVDASSPSQPGKPFERPRAEGSGAGGVRGVISSGVATTKNVLGDIFQTLAGGKKKEWVQTPEGPVAQYRDLKPGEMARGILAAALTGLASGYDPANRGRGPAMSSAFSAGFRGEDEAKQKQATSAENEAEQQFKNIGISEERKLALARNAREQQRSMELTAEHHQQSELMDLNIAKTKYDNADAIRKNDWMLGEQYNNAKKLGGTDVVGTPQSGFPSYEDANAFAHANPKLALGGNDFNTQIVRGPDGMWHILSVPTNQDEVPKIRGVVVDKDGKPVLDKDGKPQIDKENPVYGPNGKPIATLVPMTLAQQVERNKVSQDARYKESEIQWRNSEASKNWADATDKRMKREKDTLYENALKHWDEAGGDVNKQREDGTYIVTPADRTVLRNNNKESYKDARSLLQSSLEQRTKLVEAGVKDNDPKMKEINQIIAEQKQMIDVAESYQQTLGKTLVPEKSFVDSLVANHPEVVDQKSGLIDKSKAAQFIGPKIPQAMRDRIDAEMEARNKKPAAKAAPAAAPVNPKDEVAVAKSIQAKRVADETEAQKTAQKNKDLQQLKSLTTDMVPGMYGPQPNTGYRADIAEAIKAHPDWTDDQQIRFMKAMTGGRIETNPIEEGGQTWMASPDGKEVRLVPNDQIEKFTTKGGKFATQDQVDKAKK